MKITMTRKSRVMITDGKTHTVLKGTYEVLDQVNNKVKIELHDGTIVWADTTTGKANRGL